MADAKTINGYNLKDAAAREAIANLDTVKLASSGGASGSIRFGVDGEGNYGYFKAGADTVTPFSSGGSGLIQIGNYYYGNTDIDISDYPNSTRDNFLIEIYQVNISDMYLLTSSNRPQITGGNIAPFWTVQNNILHIEGMDFDMYQKESGRPDQYVNRIRAAYHVYYKP